MKRNTSKHGIALFVVVLFPLVLQAELRVVENFDDPKVAQDVWTKRQAKASKSITDRHRLGDTGQGLEVSYDVSAPRQEAGYWVAVTNKDLSGLARLSFWIKGQAGGERVTIGIKDQLNFEDKLDIGRRLDGGISREWQHVVVSLNDFPSITDWYDIRNLSFTFHHKYGPPYKGTVYIENITLEGERTGVPKLEPTTAAMPPPEALDEEAFYDLVQSSAAMFFWEEANPTNGLIKDHAGAWHPDNFKMASIASVGFGLPVLCVAESRGWLTRDQVYERVLNTLKFFRDEAYHQRGFYYHFMDIDTGERWDDNEISSIDTALLMAGVLFVREYFEGTEVAEIADELYNRVDWAWMLNGGQTLSMGWKPESGFIEHRWGTYDEQSILDLLGIGANRNALPPDVWHAISRPYNYYGPYTFIGVAPLFTHQYSHMFIDFRKARDRHMDYFENSVQATLAHRQWAIDNRKNSRSYGPDSWGLTACDGPDGYKAYGAPNGPNDGTVAPTAAIGSFPFTPEYSMSVMRNFYNNHRERLWGRYGFADAFNWDRDWVSRIHIGIDQGPIVLMIENHRTGMIWDYFMKNPYILQGLQRAGFEWKRTPIEVIDLSGGWHLKKGDDLRWARQPQTAAAWDVVYVPARWEKQGLDGYDGYAWYHRSFELPDSVKDQLADAVIELEFGAVDDVDETFLNGRLVGRSGAFPPAFETAWESPRRYRIPARLLSVDRPNHIMVRVYDSQGDGGIYKEPVRLSILEAPPAAE